MKGMKMGAMKGGGGKSLMKSKGALTGAARGGPSGVASGMPGKPFSAGVPAAKGPKPKAR